MQIKGSTYAIFGTHHPFDQSTYRPDDVSYRLDFHLFKVSSSERRELLVRTFPYVEKF
jgi:hypothetical protein